MRSLRPRLNRLTLGLWIAVSSISLFGTAGSCLAQPAVDENVRRAIVGDALLTEGAYRALGTMTDQFGPRLAGTPSNIRSMDWLEVGLKKLGLETKRQSFPFVGWVRGDDEAEIVAPFKRKLRAIAYGYVNAQPPIWADLVFMDKDSFEDFDIDSYRGRVALLPANLQFTPKQQEDFANVVGLAGILATNRKNGGELLARTANQTGAPSPLPQFNISQEEGMWLERLLAAGQKVRVRLVVNSHSERIFAQNLVARIPGRSGRKIVVGAHADSWDLGQGAMDNGLGVAQLFEMARLIEKYHPDNLHTIEFVWFNAEELGLWGSRAYVEQNDLDSVQVMINFDMAGRPIQLNAMGFDELVPILERESSNLGNWSFDQPVSNKTWLGSDHHPFIEKGVPAITFNAPIDDESVKFYHDFGDTFDKIDRQMLAQGTAVYTLVLLDLANDPSRLRHLTPEEVATLFRDAGVEERMRQVGDWPFE